MEHVRAPSTARPNHAAPATLGESPVETLIDVLRLRAAAMPEQTAFIHLVDGERDEVPIAYVQLCGQATAIARSLLERGATGKRVLLLFEAGIEYVAALMGVLMAGAVAVPSFPPVGTRALGRLALIAKDAQAELILTNARFSRLRERVLALLPHSFPEDGWLEAEAVLLAHSHAYTSNSATAAGSDLPLVAASDLALLQYTSGSTSDPKGVMLTHGNLLSNCHCASSWMGGERARIGCTWLPPYHDMGLMGGILQPIYEGFPTLILSPGHFIQQPLRWLEAISRHRVTTTIAPNFAFDLCCDTIAEDALAALDLSSLEAIYCGAEPVRRGTFERFAARFARCGFCADAFGPCYGLAEATVFVSGKPDGAAPTFAVVDQDQLARGEAATVDDDDPRAFPLASCGVPAPGHDVRIVGANGHPVPDGAIGEVWVSGPNVGIGYWKRERESRDTFQATLSGSPARYMRTGDLGFLRNGELYVTGRMKDLIIVAGRNLYPQDIELAVQEADTRIRPNGVAAFSIDDGDAERIAVVAELRRGERLGTNELQSMRQAIVERVTANFGAAPHVVHFAPMGAIPLTTSGKIQRYATRHALLSRALATYSPTGE
ncbi:hypothetical protein Busp01_45230 [Trinickia caryophylli]|nr:hypothetical protein Busp01_45230 [Trinickia caryophylli]